MDFLESLNINDNPQILEELKQGIQQEELQKVEEVKREVKEEEVVMVEVPVKIEIEVDKLGEEVKEVKQRVEELKNNMRYQDMIILFDVDGTICDSGKKIKGDMKRMIQLVKEKHQCHLGVIGGGKYEKIVDQLDGMDDEFEYIFSECGSVVYHKGKLIKKNHIMQHKQYRNIQTLIRYSLKFISETNYDVSGQFVDVRNGLVYISLVGMQATEEQREQFKKADRRMEFRKRLWLQLNDKKEKLMGMMGSKNSNLSIVYGGEVGITIYPSEWDKVQSLQNLQKYENIYYFGDRYEENGNDYQMIHHPRVHGVPVDSLEMTKDKLSEFL
jgi:phosphomannomutase